MDDPESITTVLTGDEAPVTTGPLTGVPAFELQDVDAANGEPAVNAGVATARRGEDTVEPPSPVDQTADSGPTTSPLEPGDVYLTRGQIFDAGIIHTVSPLEPGDVYLAPGQIFDLDAPRGGKQRERGPKGPTPPPTPERVAALEAEVEAAAHKTYVMGRVRRALGVVTDDQLAERLRVLETTIQAQIDERKAVKESIIQRADELKESTHWKAAGDQFKALFDEWKAVGAAGRELDDELWARFQGARETFNRRRSAYFDERQVVWAAHRETKEALCARVEAINESTDWRATADAIKAIQAEWKAIGSAGRDADDALWARFNSAKQLFFDRRAAAWAEARELKEGLIAEAEMHKDSTDWRLAAEAMKALQARWKEAGTSGPASEDELWQRFRAATQAFFDHRSATFEARHRAERENLERKRGLIEQAESLSYSTDTLTASRVAKDLQAEWKTIGPVPREQSEVLWNRFRAACDKIFGGASVERERLQTEWQIRMKEAMTRKRDQLNSLRESITHDEANIERWRETLSTLRPGGKSAEIEASLDAKILDVAERIQQKRERVEELRASIADMESKIREP